MNSKVGSRSSAATVMLGVLALLAGLLATVAGPLATAAAAPTGNVIVDPAWQPTGGVGDLVATSAMQPDGKLIVVGPFTSVNGVPRVTIARLNPDGTLDPSFDAGEGFDGPVSDIVLQPDGKILAGGKFTHVNGETRLLVARLLPNGQLDPTFVPRFPGTGPEVTPTVAGGRVPTSWRNTGASAQFRPASAITAAAATRGSAGVEPATGDPSVQGLALQPDGKIVYFGAYLNFMGTMVMGRYNSDGTVDDTFNAPYSIGQAIGDAIALPDGTTVVGGYDYINSQPILARLLANGALDATWVAGGCNGPVWRLLRLANGNILAAGGFTGCNGLARRGLVRLLSTGAVDPSFATGAGFNREGEPIGPDDIVAMPDGRLLAVGYFTAVNGVARPGIARLTGAGALDVGFVPATPGLSAGSAQGGYPWNVQVQADDRVVIVGQFGSVAGEPRTGLARLTATGAVDSAYNPVLSVGVGVDSWAADALVQPDGKVVVAGGFSAYNSDPAQALVRINTNGTHDASFSTAGTGLAFVDAVVRQPDGRFIVAGAVVVSPTALVLAVLRLNADGSRDPSFAAQRYDLGNNQQIVNTLVLQPDGKVLVAGQFTGPGGRANLMRLTPQGAPDAAFSIGTGFTYPAGGLLGVRAIVLQPDGRIVAAGAFDRVNGVARSGIVRLLPTGAVDMSFNPGGGFTGTQMMVRALVSAPGGRLLAAGRFDYYNGQPRQSIARLNGDGSLDGGFAPAGQFLQPYFPTEVTLTALVGQADGKVITTGSFVTFGGVGRAGILRLTSTGALDTSFNPGSGFGDWSYMSRLVPQSNGALVVVGNFQGFNDTFPVPLGVTRIVTVTGPPAAPTGVAVTNGDGAVRVTCTPPNPGTGGWAQRYEFSADNGATWPVSSSTPAATLSNLANGTAYQVRVRAANLAGVGAASAAVVGLPVAAVGSVFVPITPVRVVDSRVAFGGVGPIVGGSSRVVSVASSQSGGVPVVPSGAVAVAYNLTVPSPVAAGHVRVMPGDAVGLTSASAVNFRAGESIANAATVKVSAARTVKVYAGSTADVVIDVVGYFVPAGGGSAAVTSAGAPVGLFTSVVPIRVYDAAVDPAGLLAGGGSRLVSTAVTQSGGVSVVPAGASAVAYNVTVVGPSGPGHLRVAPGDVAGLTPTSVVNWSVAGERIANGSVVGVDGQRRITVFNGGGAPVRFLIDVVGYYSGSGQQFYAVDPVRTTDTRVVSGGAGPVAPAAVRTVSTAVIPGTDFTVLPAGASAMAYNLTVVNSSGAGHARVFPADSALPTASALNWPGAGYTRANASVVAVSATRQVTLYNGSTGPADLLIDVNGYYK